MVDEHVTYVRHKESMVYTRLCSRFLRLSRIQKVHRVNEYSRYSITNVLTLRIAVNGRTSDAYKRHVASYVLQGMNDVALQN